MGRTQELCKACKKTSACEHYPGIGALCRNCAPEFKTVSELIEVLDGHPDTADHLWRAGLRCLQQLEYDYQLITPEGTGQRHLHVGELRSRIGTLSGAQAHQREAMQEVIRAHGRTCCAGH